MRKFILPLALLFLTCCSSSKQASSNPSGYSYISNAYQLIEGKESGVLFNSSSSNPEVSTSLLIRGISSINAGTDPLYVVDGMPYDGPINMINPYDIESIKVLKDPSETVIYGFRGSNGVVVIKTKSGGSRKKRGSTK